MPNAIVGLKEKTFTAYTPAQGAHYANSRPDYHPDLYRSVLDHHRSTAGNFTTVIDVGCGPGLATRQLALHFDHAVGLDPSEGMLSTARSLGGVTSTSEPIQYQRSAAEDLETISEGSVDLITIANAAHWFDMPRFWVSAARALKPGGTVAIWGPGEIRAHPDMPNADAIQNAMEKHRDDHLLPYFEPGNWMTRGRYVDLPLPWTLDQPVEDFQESQFVRKDWVPEEPFFAVDVEMSLDQWEKITATSSPETRWRQANPDLAGTERDIVKVLRKTVERLQQEAGVEAGKEKVKGTVLGILLMFKKRV
ncbi:S-adenosyl-L-methionine-dependent methyltransferase [Massariosphaeria phaeospora]|uniref:S-adenosyl-L-methionine-dependent methyltransferase n=1 Tax=Massariosphaeria phaeospora TaxID=100035 RepID=A0A7C8MKV9_9PLEO|nr:S-adenosyl-L-methionine-dependent methyltransferase [Massariosphaeria phaeospora]